MSVRSADPRVQEARRGPAAAAQGLRAAPPYVDTGYDPAADVYDLEYAECCGPELEFWAGEARRLGARLLELGVGTARIAAPLARLGFEVTGVDRSAAMLRRAAARRAALPARLRGSLRLERGDMRTCRPTGTFDLAFAGFNSYLLLPDAAGRRGTLRNAARLVRPGGGVAVDVFEATPLDTAPDHEDVEFLECHPGTGWRVTRERFYSYDAAAHRGQSTLVYRFYDGPTLVDERRLGYSLALLTRDEVAAEFRAAGLEIEAVYGTYDRSSWSRTSPNLIVVGRRPGR